MSYLNTISEIIDDKFLYENQDFIIEKDTRNDGKPFEMKFQIVKSNSIEYKLYRFEEKDFPFFKELKGLKKMCDYILFAEESNYLHIFLIELKLSPDTAKKQLDAANEFAEFILKSSNRVGKFIKHYKIKKMRICQKFVNKRSKMATENNYEFDKNNYLDYKLKSVHLTHLMQY